MASYENLTEQEKKLLVEKVKEMWAKFVKDIEEYDKNYKQKAKEKGQRE